MYSVPQFQYTMRSGIVFFRDYYKVYSNIIFILNSNYLVLKSNWLFVNNFTVTPWAGISLSCLQTKSLGKIVLFHFPRTFYYSIIGENNAVREKWWRYISKNGLLRIADENEVYDMINRITVCTMAHFSVEQEWVVFDLKACAIKVLIK